MPSASRPRLADRLGPGGGRRRLQPEAVGRRRKLVRQGLSTAFRLGLGPLVFRDRLVVDGGGLDAYLTEVLGEPALVSLHIGPARANRKPVLQLLAPDGRALGYAKLGVDPLTRALVHAEADALRRLAEVPLGPVVLAGVRHHGDWHGHALLVQEALPVRLPRPPRPPRRRPNAPRWWRSRAVSAYAGSRGRPAGTRPGSPPRWTRSGPGRRPGGRAALKSVADADPRWPSAPGTGLERRQQRGAGRQPGAGLGLGTVRGGCAGRVRRAAPGGAGRDDPRRGGAGRGGPRADRRRRGHPGAVRPDRWGRRSGRRALPGGAGGALPAGPAGGGGCATGHVDTWLLPAVEEHLPAGPGESEEWGRDAGQGAGARSAR
ncbi:hypothetical protein V2I01_12700 [Micromonospora sp. BRA006-A]|nr:hypothetical protein [Micromonospora sp. BRA006-A]